MAKGDRRVILTIVNIVALDTAQSRARKPFERGRLRTAGYWIAGIIVVVIVLHLTLPIAIRKYVLHTLNRIPGYRSEVGHISLNLFRGAYQINQIKVEKTGGNVPVPFFSADQIDLSVQWAELIHGAVVGAIQIQQPALNFVNSPKSETSQTSMDKSWMERVKELFPLDIDRFEVDEGEIHFHDFSRTPNVDIYMTKTHILATNLTNSRRLSQTLVATIDAAGVIPQNGRFKLHLEADPFDERPTFQLAAEMTDVDLTQWNDFLEAYTGVQATKGEFSVFTEMKVQHGTLDGYIKPIMKSVEVARWKEGHESPFKIAWETIIAGVAELLKNHSQDQIATRIPLSGNIAHPQSGIIATIGELLRNAYLQALFPSLDGYLGRGTPANGKITEEAPSP
jgi:hypothetical protein